MKTALSALFAVMVILAIMFTNPNPAEAQEFYPVLDPRVPHFVAPAKTGELAPLRLKLGIMGSYFSVGEVHTGVPKLQLAAWLKLAQHHGIELMLNTGYMQVKSGDMEQGVDTLFMTVMGEYGYRTVDDTFQFLAGFGWDAMRELEGNGDLTNAFVASAAIRWQFAKKFGCEVRYTPGIAWDGRGEQFFRQEVTAGLYWAITP